MQKVFEKIIEKLEEKQDIFLYDDSDYGEGKYNAFDEAIEIVKQEAEQYNNGWIPCSEQLPKDDSICIVTVEYPNNEATVDYGWFDRKGVCWFVGMQEFRTSNVLAWQPLPELYQPKGE